MNLKRKLAALVAGVSLFAQSAVTAFAAEGNNGGNNVEDPSNSPANLILIILYVVVLIAMFYFLIIRPQKKRKKEEENMRNNIIVGADVVTIGGICGKIVQIKDDTLTIQTSIDNTLVEFKNWAVREIVAPVSDEK